MIAELLEALNFYIRDPKVEAPVEFFHSVLASTFGADTSSLWTILRLPISTFLWTTID
jgi:hypothetical protein